MEQPVGYPFHRIPQALEAPEGHWHPPNSVLPPAAPKPAPTPSAGPRRAGKGTLAELGLVKPASPVEPSPQAPAPAPPPTFVEVADRPAPPPPGTDTLTQIPRHSFICGEAGSGKTYRMQERVRRAQPGEVVLAATTGIAAVNLGENVVTINSLLGYFDTASLRDLFTTGRLEAKLLKLAKAGTRNLVLDEVSMLDGDQLNILHLALDSVNEARDAAGEPILTLTLTGDFLQLPPVKAKFAFEVEHWKHYEANLTKLTQSHRQADPRFLAALGMARRGDAASAVDYFRPFVHPLVDPTYRGVTLMAKNDQVDRYNQVKLAELPGSIVEWKCQLWGEQRTEWKHIPPKLAIKPGTFVMILANKKDATDRERFLCVNGDVGIVEEMQPDKGIIWVKLQRNGIVVPVSYIQRDHTIPLEPGRSKELRDAGLEDRIKDGKQEIIGQITYMPLRPAWATTVHKSQGLTLDYVQLDIRDNFYRSAGMVYVALSRVRSPDGLRIVGNPRTLQGRINLDPRVRRWA